MKLPWKFPQKYRVSETVLEVLERIRHAEGYSSTHAFIRGFNFTGQVILIDAFEQHVGKAGNH